jgi:hypothetical protein
MLDLASLLGIHESRTEAGKLDPLRNLAPAHRARIEKAMAGSKKAASPARTQPAAAPKKASAPTPTKAAPIPSNFAHLLTTAPPAPLRMHQEVKREPADKGEDGPTAEQLAMSVITAMSAQRRRVQN